MSAGKFVRYEQGTLTLHGNNISSLALDHLRNHVVNQTMLVPDAGLFEFRSVLRLVDLLEDVLEAPIIGLENGVLGAHVQRVLLVQRKLEAGLCKTRDTLVRVVLCLRNTSVLELEHLNLFWLAAFGGEDHLEGTGTLDDPVLGAVLVAECVTSDDNGLGPAWDETGNAGDDNWFSEDCTAAVSKLAQPLAQLWYGLPTGGS